jgi:hypothetical protein
LELFHLTRGKFPGIAVIARKGKKFKVIYYSSLKRYIFVPAPYTQAGQVTAIPTTYCPFIVCSTTHDNKKASK